jgi:hypothetical protein
MDAAEIILSDAAIAAAFLPETARRWGQAVMFPGPVSVATVGGFLQRPEESFVEQLNGMSAASKAALVIVFMGGGTQVAFPLQILSPRYGLTADQQQVLTFFGCAAVDYQQVLNSLVHFYGNVLLEERVNGERVWSFHHPSLIDAVSTFIAQHQLFDLFIRYCTWPQLLVRVACKSIEAHASTAPDARFSLLIQRFSTPSPDDRQKYCEDIARFLGLRCLDAFLQAAVISSWSLIAVPDDWVVCCFPPSCVRVNHRGPGPEEGIPMGIVAHRMQAFFMRAQHNVVPKDVMRGVERGAGTIGKATRAAVARSVLADRVLTLFRLRSDLSS